MRCACGVCMNDAYTIMEDWLHECPMKSNAADYFDCARESNYKLVYCVGKCHRKSLKLYTIFGTRNSSLFDMTFDGGRFTRIRVMDLTGQHATLDSGSGAVVSTMFVPKGCTILNLAHAMRSQRKCSVKFFQVDSYSAKACEVRNKISHLSRHCETDLFVIVVRDDASDSSHVKQAVEALRNPFRNPFVTSRDEIIEIQGPSIQKDTALYRAFSNDISQKSFSLAEDVAMICMNERLI